MVVSAGISAERAAVPAAQRQAGKTGTEAKPDGLQHGKRDPVDGTRNTNESDPQDSLRSAAHSHRFAGDGPFGV